MEVAMNLLSSSSRYPSRTTHLKIITNTTPPHSFSVSMLHEQTSVIPSMPTTSLWRQFPTSALSHEQRDECRLSSPIVREEKSSQSTLDTKKIEDDASIPVLIESYDQQVGDLNDQPPCWSGLSYLLPCMQNKEHSPAAAMDTHKHTVVKSRDVISLAKEALSASKLALSLAQSCDSPDFDGSLSPRSKDKFTVEQRKVMSTKLLERRAKRRRSSKPKVAPKTGGFPKLESRRSGEGFDFNDPLRLFLCDPETRQLLTLQEEKELIRHIQGYGKLVDVERRLHSEFGREPTIAEWADAVGLSPTALRSEILSWKRSRDKLIYANFRMVVHIAKQYQGRGLSLQDLMQEGGMGLMKSVEKFKPQAGCRFPSYAYWWIRQSIRKAIYQHSRTIRLPENMYTLHGKVLEARRLCIQEGLHHPTTEQLAHCTGITVEKLQNLLLLMRNPLSMQQSVWTDQDTTFQEVTADPKIENPDTYVEKQLMRKHIANLLGNLTPREQHIIKFRYGIGLANGKRSSLSEIGAKFNLSKERVRQIESCALDKLKQSLMSHGLDAYTELLL